MTTLPDDYARCHGVLPRQIGGYVPQWSSKHPCVACLRRTAPMSDNVLYSYFAAPEFTTTCPERIAP
jgi:hypothetical protein